MNDRGRITMTQLHELGVAELSRLLDEKQVSSVELSGDIVSDGEGEPGHEISLR